MYGYAKLSEVVAEVPKTGATAIDLWPKVHGDQREQLDAMGEAAFEELLQQHGVTLGCITQYKLGPFGLQAEMRLAERLGCHLMVTGGSGPKNLRGQALKEAVGDFANKLKPHLAVAAETGVTIAIENHGRNLIDSPDSLKWLIELAPSPQLGIALAPAHLPQDAHALAKLIEDLGDRLALFYGWQFGKGFSQQMPEADELEQLPGRGPLDFGPAVQTLKKIGFQDWTEVMMHPTPRGIPILDTTEQVTAAIKAAHDYLRQ